MTAFFKAAAFVSLAAIACGCASGLPKYIEPTDANVAVLKGNWGTFITRVDGEEVSGGLRFSNFGSNEVNVTPGEHELRVETEVGNLHQEVTFRFRADAGHEYLFNSKNMFNTTIKVTDLTTGQTMLID